MFDPFDSQKPRARFSRAQTLSRVTVRVDRLPRHWRRPVTRLASTLAALLLATATPAAEPDLASVSAAAEQFRDVNVALAEGYVAAAACETAVHMGRPAALGGMGVHYFRPDLLGIISKAGERVHGDGLHTDFMRPAILIYEPQPDGRMELVAVENLVFEAAWRAAGHDRPPTFHGRSWDYMADDPSTPFDEAHGFAPHFDQHLWLFRDNPAGIYEPFNPNISCAHHAGGGTHGAGHGAHAGH